MTGKWINVSTGEFPLGALQCLSLTLSTGPLGMEINNIQNIITSSKSKYKEQALATCQADVLSVTQDPFSRFPQEICLITNPFFYMETEAKQWNMPKHTKGGAKIWTQFFWFHCLVLTTGLCYLAVVDMNAGLEDGVSVRILTTPNDQNLANWDVTWLTS